MDGIWKEILEKEKPKWAFCPICEKILEGEGFMGGAGRKYCQNCEYVYQEQGSYASLVTIKQESFSLDDMFDDSKKLDARIAELKAYMSLAQSFQNNTLQTQKITVE